MNEDLDLDYVEFNEIIDSMNKQYEEILKLKGILMTIVNSDASTPDQKRNAKSRLMKLITMLRELTISIENIGGALDEDNN